MSEIITFYLDMRSDQDDNGLLLLELLVLLVLLVVEVHEHSSLEGDLVLDGFEAGTHEDVQGWWVVLA